MIAISYSEYGGVDWHDCKETTTFLKNNDTYDFTGQDLKSVIAEFIYDMIQNMYVDTIEKGIDEWLAGYGYIRNGLYYDHAIEEDHHRTIAFFCHGGSSSVAIAHIMNLPFPYVCALLHMEFTGITILRMDRRKGPCTLPCLELANDSRHVKEGYYHRLSNK